MYAKDRITVVDRREMLRVKAASLAAEARIIKAEERKPKNAGLLQIELYKHRVFVVRREARATCLALGFIRGKTLDQMEPTRKTEPDMDKVMRLLKTYGPKHLTSVSAAA